jgi:CRISPR/Cas system-associated endonuclease Cas3-HD
MAFINGSIDSVSIVVPEDGGIVIRCEEPDFNHLQMWNVLWDGAEKLRFAWIIRSGGSDALAVEIGTLFEDQGNSSKEFQRFIRKDDHKSYAFLSFIKDEYGSGGVIEAVIYLEENVFKTVLDQFQSALQANNMVYSISFHTTDISPISESMQHKILGNHYIVNGVAFSFGRGKVGH